MIKRLPWLRRLKKTAPEPPLRLPIAAGPISNGEGYWPDTPRKRLIRKLVMERAEEISRKHNVDRREFLASSCGMATTLMVLNLVNGCTRSRNSTHSTGNSRPGPFEFPEAGSTSSPVRDTSGSVDGGSFVDFVDVDEVCHDPDLADAVLHISQEFQERFGYPALTWERKEKILGRNAARLQNLHPDVNIEGCHADVAGVPFTQLQRDLDAEFGPRRDMMFEVPGPRTRREFMALVREEQHEKAFWSGRVQVGTPTRRS